LDPILNHMNSVHILPTNFFNINSNITLPFNQGIPDGPSLQVSNQNILC